MPSSTRPSKLKAGLIRLLGGQLPDQTPESPAAAYQRRKAELYQILQGQSKGDSMALLSEMAMEIVAPNINLSAIQEKTREIQIILAELGFSDRLYLLQAAFHHQVVTHLGAPGLTTEKGP